MRAVIVSTAALLSACAPKAEGEILPSFVEGSPDRFALRQSAVDDAYIFNDFRDADAKWLPELAGALVVIDSPKVWVTSLCDVTGGALVEGETGWQFRPEPQQCSEREIAARARLQAMIAAGATMTINNAGELVVASPDGSSARGNVMISETVD